ncbi:sensor domain-containing diguanylate cyclase [Aurantivibrio plasticivorans]
MPANSDWDQLDQIHRNHAWQEPKVDTLNITTNSTLWIRFDVTVNTKSEQNWMLEILWPHISLVEIAILDNQNTLSNIQRAGKSIPITEGTSHKNIAFPLKLQTESATVYLKIEDQNFIYIPMMLFSDKAYQKHDLTRTIMFSMVFGILLVMILYNLSLYFAVRDSMYLFYTNTVFSSFLYLLAVSGYGRLLWPTNDWLNLHASPVFASYCFLSVTYFFRIFLDLPRYTNWLLKANTGMLIGLTVVLLFTLTPFLGYAMLLLGSLSGILGILAIVTSFVVWRRGNRSAIYFVVAWTGVGISTTFMVLTLRGEINYSPLLEYSQAASFVIEIVLLSLALADRIRRQRIAKESAQKSLLQLQQKTNKELEDQVKLRTEELENAMTKLQVANSELAKLTKTDPLTGVNNRRQFDEVAEYEIARASRTGQPLSLMMVDIDHFKAINDNCGHQAGDRCLTLVASCIATNVRKPNDMVARYGGEEFALVLPETDEPGAHHLAERIRKAIENISVVHEGKSIKMTASIGVSTHQPSSEESTHKLIQLADTALYRAKENGRNQVALSSENYPSNTV